MGQRGAAACHDSILRGHKAVGVREEGLQYRVENGNLKDWSTHLLCAVLGREKQGWPLHEDSAVMADAVAGTLTMDQQGAVLSQALTATSKMCTSSSTLHLHALLVPKLACRRQQVTPHNADILGNGG